MCCKNKRFIISLCVLTIGVNSCALVEKKEVKNVDRAAIAVTTHKVDFEQIKSTNTYIGTVRSAKTTILSSYNSGTVTKLTIRRGDKVSKGQVIAIIDAPNVVSSHEIAHATLRQAEDGYKRAQQVYDSGSISEVKMVEIKTQYEQALSSAAIADNALKKCIIEAPFDAFVEDIYVSDLESVDALQAIVKLVNLNDIEISFNVPESEISKVPDGQLLNIEVPALNLQNIDAVVSSKGVIASALSHSYSCTAVLIKNAKELLPGMVCKINLINNSSEMIIIPSSVLLLDINGKYVWVVEEGKAQKRWVEVEGFSADGIKIKSGLKPGDEIIIEGYQKVSTGMKVYAEKEK